jgi:tRNA1(Val) A37 N6-methylase TrmN6
MHADPEAVSDDAVLGGRLRLLQPARGHRVGHDAILLAASTAARSGEIAVDLGAGVGGAGLAVALRVAGVSMHLVEIDPSLAALAAENAVRNGLSSRVRVHVLDVTGAAAAFAAAGLEPAGIDRALMNPPFNDPARQNASLDRRRRLAHVAAPDMLAAWTHTAARLLRAGGVLTLIHRADGLPELLAALAPSFGAVAVQPVHPRPGAAAIRVLARGVKGSRAPLSILPGLVLQDAAGAPSAEAEAALRAAEVLPLATLD